MSRWTIALLLWGTLAGLSFSSEARAERRLDVAENLEGLELGRHVALLEDRSGTLAIEDVVRPDTSRRFAGSTAAVPNFGFTSSVYWIRLTTENSSDLAQSWLLELAYPLLDDVTLYVPRAEHTFDVRRTGDTHPFRQRDIAYRNFVFSLEEPARATRTYYLRVATTGAMRLPLIARSLKDFLEHQHLDWGGLCIFYGVVLIMACYNACVFAATRQRVYLEYAAYITAVALYQFTLAGHTFQFLLPDNPALVHQLSPATGAAAFAFACSIVSTSLLKGDVFETLIRHCKACCIGLVALSFVFPYTMSIKLLTLVAAVVPMVQVAATIALVRRRAKQARLLLIGWASIVAGVMVSMLQHTGIIPASFLTTWSVHIGISIQVVLLASGLADKINTARAELDAVNLALSHKLAALSSALARADDANQRAERATRVRDEFIATMSHEFRTPLNPIINIPQGLLQEFRSIQHAVCSGCDATFELDADESIANLPSCPDCNAAGTFRQTSTLRFTGSPAQARHLLTKVERSGVHLLQVVNGILDFSTLEAGQLKLVREQFEPTVLVRDILAELYATAQRAEIQLVCSAAPDSLPSYGDAQRIRQVLVRLIENAIRFRNGPGSVTIGVESRDDALRFSVADQGIGLAKQHFDSIFSSFEQVHKGNTRRYGGTGLGLSIARSLVRLHGGEMWVESELGVGSTFFFSIPGRAGAPAPFSLPNLNVLGRPA